MQVKDVVRIRIGDIWGSEHHVNLMFYYRVPAVEGAKRPDDLVSYYTSHGSQESGGWDFLEEFVLFLSKTEANEALKAILSLAPDIIVGI